MLIYCDFAEKEILFALLQHTVNKLVVKKDKI